VLYFKVINSPLLGSSFIYKSSDQGFPISSDGARACLHGTAA
jgi:hypothetical protein